MTDKIVALDTNILIYLHDNSNKTKRSIAKELAADIPKISTQVISEYINASRRIVNLSKSDLLIQSAELFAQCDIVPVLATTLLLASELAGRYHFQLFDSIIVASAIESNCDILYSEDMHHGLLVNNKLTIINPFL